MSTPVKSPSKGCIANVKNVFRDDNNNYKKNKKFEENKLLHLVLMYVCVL